MKLHHKDHSSRRGLLRKVGERRRLLRYLKQENPKSYDELAKKIKLKQAKILVKPEIDGEAIAEDVKNEDVDTIEE